MSCSCPSVASLPPFLLPSFHRPPCLAPSSTFLQTQIRRQSSSSTHFSRAQPKYSRPPRVGHVPTSTTQRPHCTAALHPLSPHHYHPTATRKEQARVGSRKWRIALTQHLPPSTLPPTALPPTALPSNAPDLPHPTYRPPTYRPPTYRPPTQSPLIHRHPAHRPPVRFPTRSAGTPRWAILRLARGFISAGVTERATTYAS